MVSVCYSVPEWFEEKLHLQSSGRLRIRWSVQKQAWQIEQKFHSPYKPYSRNAWDDTYIRARDGYAFLMEIQPGDRMPCPKCGLDVKLKSFINMESTCRHCKSKGKDGRVPGCYFPLGEALLEHLRKGDPLTGGLDRLRKEVDEHNRQWEIFKERAHANEIEAITKDHFPNMFEIQSVGYTGKELK